MGKWSCFLSKRNTTAHLTMRCPTWWNACMNWYKFMPPHCIPGVSYVVISPQTNIKQQCQHVALLSTSWPTRRSRPLWGRPWPWLEGHRWRGWAAVADCRRPDQRAARWLLSLARCSNLCSIKVHDNTLSKYIKSSTFTSQTSVRALNEHNMWIEKTK